LHQLRRSAVDCARAGVVDGGRVAIVLLDLAGGECGGGWAGIGIIQDRGEKRDERASGLAGECRVGARDGEMLPWSLDSAGRARL
jgi:hypothetical protein